MAAPSSAPTRTAPTDRGYERIRRRIGSLDPLLSPRSVAIVADGLAGDRTAEAVFSTI
jgi:hypothetical protein